MKPEYCEDRRPSKAFLKTTELLGLTHRGKYSFEYSLGGITYDIDLSACSRDLNGIFGSCMIQVVSAVGYHTQEKVRQNIRNVLGL